MFRTLPIAALATCIASTAPAQTAGYSPLAVAAPHHGRDVLGAVWYPAGDGGRSFTFGENGVFHGVTVVEEAPVQPGAHPVVLLSHGMGGNIRSLAWLSAGLAERGAIVISVNHPNSTWGDYDPDKLMNHWTRAQDLNVALDALLADPTYGAHLDTGRIMAAGFSYGGWTALSLAGLRGNHAGYLAHCETYREVSSACVELLEGEVSLRDASPTAWNASYADARVSHAVAIDPGLVWGLEASDLDGLVANVSLIGLGDGESRMLATDFDASGLAQMLPHASYDHIPAAFHFSALPLCKPLGAAILIEEGDDPVCTDPDGADRAAVHDKIIARIASDLGL